MDASTPSHAMASDTHGEAGASDISLASRRLFIDVSRTFGSPYHTGIQKVVRGLYRGLMEIGPGEGFQIVPVLLTRNGAVALADLPPHEFELARPGGRPSLRTRTRRSAQAGLNHVRRILWSASRNSVLADHMLKLARRLTSMMRHGLAWFSDPAGRPTVSFRSGDVLLLPDTSWLIDPWPAVEAIHRAGGTVVSVWYDVIPILRPDFFHPDLPGPFRSYFDKTLAKADLVVAISGSVEDEITRIAQTDKIALPRLAHAWPGITLSEPAEIQPQLQTLLERATIVIVATLEPRKGHALLLDAMERLWANGYDANLLIIGRQGWNVEGLMQRIRTHEKFETRLFHRDDLGDGEVVTVLQRASLLVLPSAAEGLGLPIIEAELAGCPVVCSDIPVFREVASSQTRFFAPHDARALSRVLAEELDSGTDKTRRAHVMAERNARALGHGRYARELLGLIEATARP